MIFYRPVYGLSEAHGITVYADDAPAVFAIFRIHGLAAQEFVRTRVVRRNRNDVSALFSGRAHRQRMGRLETAVLHFAEPNARAQDVELSEIEAFFRKGIQKVSRFVQNLRKWSEKKIPLEFPIRLFRGF